MKNKNITSLLIGTGLALSANSAYANISFSGSLADDPNSSEINFWSRTSVVKSSDIDGDNFYGTDGYLLMNTSNDGTVVGPLDSKVESSPSYLSDIAYTGAGTGGSASFKNASIIRNPGDTTNVRLGYSGFFGDSGVAIPLQELFTYTMNRDTAAGETIRMGIIADTYGTDVTRITALRVVAGGDIANATIVGASNNGVFDMYFFDITGLSNGDEIEIWGANDNTTAGAFNAATISGVTFDSAVPEPGSFALLAGCLALTSVMLRRRQG